MISCVQILSVSCGCLSTSFQLETAEASKPTKPTKTAQSFTFHSHVEFDFFWHLEISQSTVYIHLFKPRAEVVVSPGVHLGPRRQQHPADLRAAVARRPVQRGAAGDVLRGHGAGHRPQQVPHRAEATAPGRREDVVAASGATGRPGRAPVEGPQRPQGRPKKSLKEDLS